MQLLQNKQLALVLIHMHNRLHAGQLKRQSNNNRRCVIDKRAVFQSHKSTRRLGTLKSAILEQRQLFEHIDQLTFLVACLNRTRCQLDFSQISLQKFHIGLVQQAVEVMDELGRVGGCVRGVFVFVAESAEQIETRCVWRAEIGYVAGECRMSQNTGRD